MSDTEDQMQLPDSENPHAAEFAVLEALKAENAELKDQRLRALAEVENVRRRAQKEREDTAVRAASTSRVCAFCSAHWLANMPPSLLLSL